MRRRLEAWREWRFAGDPSAYPPHSWEGRAILRGDSAPVHQPGRLLRLRDHRREEEVERAVRSMPPVYREVLVLEYLARTDHGRPLSPEAQAATAGVSHAGLYQLRGQALAWLHGRLSA